MHPSKLPQKPKIRIITILHQFRDKAARYQLSIKGSLWQMVIGAWQFSDADLLMSDGYSLVFMGL
jgi:hypothetical protein